MTPVGMFREHLPTSVVSPCIPIHVHFQHQNIVNVLLLDMPKLFKIKRRHPWFDAVLLSE